LRTRSLVVLSKFTSLWGGDGGEGGRENWEGCGGAGETVLRARKERKPSRNVILDYYDAPILSILMLGRWRAIFLRLIYNFPG